MGRLAIERNVARVQARYGLPAPPRAIGAPKVIPGAVIAPGAAHASREDR